MALGIIRFHVDCGRLVARVNCTSRSTEVAERTVRELARRGQLPGRKVGKGWRFSRSGLVQWVNGGNPAADPDQGYFWSESWQQGEREADKDIAAGRVYSMKDGESPDEALRRLSREID